MRPTANAALPGIPSHSAIIHVVTGIHIARNLVAAGNRRAAAAGLTNCTFHEGDASQLAGVADHSLDLVVSLFGAIFASRPLDVAKELVRVMRVGGRIGLGTGSPVIRHWSRRSSGSVRRTLPRRRRDL